MSMSLYEIDSNIKAILDSIYDATDENGEVAEADFTALLELQEERKVKLSNITLYIKNCDAEAAAIKAEEENLAKRRKRLERKSESLQGLLIRSMTENNEPVLETPQFKAKIRKTERTEIIDKTLIPKEFINVKTEEVPDKTAIKKAIKAGQDVAGAALVEHTTINIT